MGEDVPIFATLTTGAVLIATHVGRLIRASIQHRTIREALSRDSAAVPALLIRHYLADKRSNGS